MLELCLATRQHLHMTSNFDAERSNILAQMARLKTMAFGSLKEEFRTNASGDKVGPYYQLQAWHEGANLSRRVPAEEAPVLQEAVANRQKFEALAEEFIELTVARTRKQAAADAQKKTSSVLLRKTKRSPR